jgi:TonB family protein
MMDALLSANLVAWAVQAGVLVVVAAPLPWLLRLWSPRVRLAFWRAVLMICLLLPLLQPWQTRPAAPSATPAPAAAAYGVDVVGVADAPAASTAGAVGPRAPWTWPRVAGVAIVTGVLLRLCWLGLGLITVTRLRRAAMRLWPRPASVDRAATLAETDAEFLVSPTAVRPVTCGLLWPVVMVPRTFESFPECEQTAIACHELIHVSRADWARNVVDELLRAVLWFHPAIWWLIDQIQLAREQVVDREAVTRLGARQSYLEALLRLARPAPRHVLTPAPLFLKRAHLRQRVSLLVKEAAMSRARLVVSVMVMAIVVLIGGRLVTWALPLQQEATGAALMPVGAGMTALDKALPADLGAASTDHMPESDRAGGTTLDSGAPLRSEPGDTPVTTERATSNTREGLAPGATPRQGLQSAPAKLTHTVVRRVDPQPAEGLTPVVVRVDVGPAGVVTNADIVTPASPGDSDAIAAARQWTFAPTQEPWVTYIGFSFAAWPSGQPLSVGGNIVPPIKTRDVKPAYPADAKDAGIQGMQIVDGTINTDGRVVDAVALMGNDELIAAALSAVTRWEFKPAVVNGEPVAVRMTVTVNFTLQGANVGVGAADPAGQQPFRIPSAWPSATVRVGDGVKPPNKVRDVKPIYPPDALAARVQGVVVADVLIGPDGRVNDAILRRSIPLLDDAALEAVRQWEFTPTLLNGTPVSVAMSVTVNFTLQ